MSVYIKSFEHPSRPRDISWDKDSFTVWKRESTHNKAIVSYPLSIDGLSIALAYAGRDIIGAHDALEEAKRLWWLGAKKAHAEWLDS